MKKDLEQLFNEFIFRTDLEQNSYYQDRSLVRIGRINQCIYHVHLHREGHAVYQMFGGSMKMKLFSHVVLSVYGAGAATFEINLDSMPEIFNGIDI